MTSLLLISPSYGEPDRDKAINLIIKAGELAEKCSQDVKAHEEDKNIFNSIFPPHPPTERYDNCRTYDNFYKYEALPSFNTLWSWHLSITDAYFEKNALESLKKDLIRAVQSIDSTERLLAKTDSQRSKPATLDISFTDSGKRVVPDGSFIRVVKPELPEEPEKLEKTHSDEEIRLYIPKIIRLGHDGITKACYSAIQTVSLSARLTNSLSPRKVKIYRETCKKFVDKFALTIKDYKTLPTNMELEDYFTRYPESQKEFESYWNYVYATYSGIKSLDLIIGLTQN